MLLKTLGETCPYGVAMKDSNMEHQLKKEVTFDKRNKDVMNFILISIKKNKSSPGTKAS